MDFTSEVLSRLQSLFRLDFLFSGLEVSSVTLLSARLVSFLLLGGAMIWGTFRIVLKLLDCVQTFLAGIGQLPRSFFLVLLLTVPLSPNSIGAKWLGYLLIPVCIITLGMALVLIAVVWKHGADQAVRFVRGLSRREREVDHAVEASACRGSVG
jgi:hypothetical protein